jgi:hypothetical protein
VTLDLNEEKFANAAAFSPATGVRRWHSTIQSVRPSAIAGGTRFCSIRRNTAAVVHCRGEEAT